MAEMVISFRHVHPLDNSILVYTFLSNRLISPNGFKLYPFVLLKGVIISIFYKKIHTKLR